MDPLGHVAQEPEELWMNGHYGRIQQTGLESTFQDFLNVVKSGDRREEQKLGELALGDFGALFLTVISFHEFTYILTHCSPQVSIDKSVMSVDRTLTFN
jgi:hypothetical protein